MFDDSNLKFYFYYNDVDSNQWVTANPVNDGGIALSVSETAPSGPSEGDLWLDSSNLKTFVYYNDGNSSQWIRITQVL